jgi:pseudo-rSAM protein
MTQDFLDNTQKIKNINWPPHIQFNILIDSAFDFSFFGNISFPFSITAFVFSEQDFMYFTDRVESFSIRKNIQIIPLYSKKNLFFFESNVFTEKGDLENINLLKNEIFMRQALNTGDFGKLTIMPDGQVYANVNKPALGNIDDSPYSIVYKEFQEGKSWFRIRNQAPCTDCIYQWLCPSPSSYEIVIGRPNLCHIVKDGITENGRG